MPRGSRIKSSGPILAVAVYVGMKTKQMLNITNAKTKTSKSDFTQVLIIIVLIVVMLILSLVATLLADKTNRSNAEIYFSWLLILSRLVPASLMVSM